MLQPLGISAEAEAVYLALGPLESAAVPDLSRLTGLSARRTGGAVEELRGLGLAHACSGTWRALPLLDVVDQLRRQRLSEVERSVVSAEAFASQLLARAPNPAEGLTVLHGHAEVVGAHHELNDSARREVLAFDKPPYAIDRTEISEQALSSTPEWRVLERGVDCRVVYHPGFDPDRLQELTLFVGKGEQARTAPVPMKLIVADARAAMVPSMRSYDPGHELRATLVRNPLLVEALVFLFEAVWEAAVPILTTFTGAPDSRRRLLVSLLMTGATDTAIAKALGVNVRSVRRWVAELMAELGVRTRLQLGAALVRADQAQPLA